MNEALGKYFGLVIAFLIPGFVGLWGISYVFPIVKIWIIPPDMANATIASFFYVLLASLTIGMMLSAIRWMFIDSIHSITGLKKPEYNFGNLIV